jgi:hypothetical protein
MLSLDPISFSCRAALVIVRHLLAGIDAPKLGYECAEHVPTTNATHVVLTKRR